ncbi:MULTISPECIES: pentapeptide repeat-containing protein [unclassified Roseofilum]|uniref:pentapeptide repeat-containing protein n=1 Tax=unclassified Roseofilum TaxID=2620099 RepID=UPI001B0BFB48|nr:MULTISPECIES: pentapeptide repeat-containing protein [unclassified Roseofilum]MBP0010716.1 pentapeptide repeat-containing protein [Roseofilum sp. Belize Diploria]MBP0035334.1 pentapeptide repeat-containing protein [Roseofilum sp. Belize BBD 4]
MAFYTFKTAVQEESCRRNFLSKYLLKYLLWSNFGDILDSSNMSFCNQNLSGIDLSNNRLDWRNTSFSQADLSKSIFADSTFTQVTFNQTKLMDADLRNTVFENSSLDQANFENANLNQAIFKYVTLEKTSFNTQKLGGAIFINSDLSKLADPNKIYGNLSSGNIKVCCSKLPLELGIEFDRDCQDSRVSLYINEDDLTKCHDQSSKRG